MNSFTGRNSLFWGRLILVLLIAAFVISAFADFAGGDGLSEETAWQIETAEQMNNVRNYLGTAHSSKYFKLMNDIDLSSYEDWTPIGRTTAAASFQGNFDGNDKKITGLTITTNSTYRGLFGYVSAASIKNLHLRGVDIYAGGYSGTLAAYLHNTTVENCSVTGELEGTSSYIGGFAGYMNGSTVSNSWSDVAVLSNNSHVAGFTPYFTGTAASINSCYASGKVTSTSTNMYIYMAGLVGYQFTGTFINDSYATGDVISTANRGYVGGFIGYAQGTVNRCYSTGNVGTTYTSYVGGLIGRAGTINDSYYNSETSGKSDTGRGNRKTTAEMIDQDTYTNWDFTVEPVWSMIDDLSYPYLAWQDSPNIPGPLNLIAVVDDEQVELTWDTPSVVPEGYNVYRDGVLLNTVGLVSDPTYTDTGMENYIEYKYQVSSVFDLVEFPELVNSLPSTVLCTPMVVAFAGGDGTSGTPFQISNAGHLNLIRNYLGSSNSNVYFELINDVDMADYSTFVTGAGWEVLGSSAATGYFYGTLDGKGHKISNLFIDRPISMYQGLFGYVRGTIKNLGLESIDLNVGAFSGALAGYMRYSFLVEDCYATGTITSNRQCIGGLIGYLVDGSVINSWTNVLITSSNSQVGGLAGYSNATVEKCHALGDVTGAGLTGGLIGFKTTAGSVSNCYATGNVTGTDRVGGLIGDNRRPVSNSFSIGEVSGTTTSVGGLVGTNSGTVTNSYYNTETSLQVDEGKGEPRTTAEMTYTYAENTFVDWDFETIWAADIKEDINNGYPFLQWQTYDPYAQNGEIEQPLNPAGNYDSLIGDHRVIFVPARDEQTMITINVTVSTNKKLNAVKLLENPNALGAYFKFEVSDVDVFSRGINIKLQFDKKPNGMSFRHGEGDWRSIPFYWSAENNYVHLYIPNLPFGTRSNVFEFAGDNGEQGQTLPVALSSFTANVTANNFVELKWISESETNMLGYNIYRNTDNELTDANRLSLNIIPANNSSTTSEYRFIDEDVNAEDTYYYWLQSIDLDLTNTFFGPVIVNLTAEDPEEVTPTYITALQKNFPNPFNPSTIINYSIREEINVSLVIYNIRGQAIKTLVNSIQQAGKYELIWNGTDDNGKSVGSGVYFYRLTTEHYDKINKMLLVK